MRIGITLRWVIRSRPPSAPGIPWCLLRIPITDVRAFLHPDLSGSADTQNQNRHIDDDYFDTHLTNKSIGDTTLIVGTDLLYGLGTQTTLNGNGAYTVPLNGSVLPPPTSELPVNEIGTVNDQRVFAGQYAQFDWNPMIAGMCSADFV